MRFKAKQMKSQDNFEKCIRVLFDAILSICVLSSKKIALQRESLFRGKQYLVRLSLICFVVAMIFGVSQLLHLDFTYLVNKIQSMLLGRGLHFLFHRLGWASGLFLATLFFILGNENKMMMAGDSGSDSSDWRKYLNLSSDKEGNAESESSTGHTPGHQPTVGQPIQTQPRAAWEALPHAPAEVAHPAPHQEELAELKMAIHGFIQQQIREESERGVGPLSKQFSDQGELNSGIAHHIMDDLEISAETNIDSLHEWAERLEQDTTFLKPLIKDYLPPKR